MQRALALVLAVILIFSPVFTPALLAGADPGKSNIKALSVSRSGQYKIGVGDVLQISVWENPDLEQQVTVRPDGRISFPLIDDIDVKGLEMNGKYVVKSVNTDDPTSKNFPKNGFVGGKGQNKTQDPLPEPVTFTCNLQGGLVGGDPKFGDRSLTLILGVEAGKIISAQHATISQKGAIVGKKAFDPGDSSLTATRDKLTARVLVPT